MYQNYDTSVLWCPCPCQARTLKWAQEQPDSDRPDLPHRRGGGSGARGAPAEVLPMFFERLTAWTLVIVYYTITCGAIVLGLRGAL
jgi:hypothetical protein